MDLRARDMDREMQLWEGGSWYWYIAERLNPIDVIFKSKTARTLLALHGRVMVSLVAVAGKQ